MYMHLYVYTHTHMCVRVYVCTCVRMYVCITSWLRPMSGEQMQKSWIPLLCSSRALFLWVSFRSCQQPELSGQMTIRAPVCSSASLVLNLPIQASETEEKSQVSMCHSFFSVRYSLLEFGHSRQHLDLCLGPFGTSNNLYKCKNCHPL